MYKCPECGSDYVKVTMNLPIERVWKGNDIESENEADEYREPQIVLFECQDCGYVEDAYDDDWFDGDV